jgi:hypothetical protein
LLLYELVAEERGVKSTEISGTIQNDLLKEYIARGTYIYPPRPSMRIITDIFAYCAKHVPKWNTISISGYHIREAGSTAVQELAFTVSNAIAYVQAAIDSGLTRDLYVSLGEQVEGGAWIVRVYVKPFIDWIWFGCLFMALGGLLAVSDRRYRRAAGAEQ